MIKRLHFPIALFSPIKEVINLSLTRSELIRETILKIPRDKIDREIRERERERDGKKEMKIYPFI